MKISFSTLGCPGFEWSDIYSMAKDFGFDGIEIRGMGKDIFQGVTNPFSEERIENTIFKLRKMHLAIPCLTTGCVLKYKENWESIRHEIFQYIELASKIGAPYIRLLGDRDTQVEGEVDDEIVLMHLQDVIPEAEKYGVVLLIETNGVYADTRRLRNLLINAKSDSVAALWDMHHPYRFMNESPETTVQNLGVYIKHVHTKDSRWEDGKVVYRMMGEGDMPIKDMINALRSVNYEGFISLEWVKAYMPELMSAGIVFPHYASYMQQFLSGEAGNHRLQDNIRKNGKYIWPKETLLDLTFPQILDRICDEFPEQYAFRYTTLDYTRTYSQFRDDVDEMARALISLGVRQGDHVAVWATNVPEWYITFWATVKIGAVLVTVNTAYKIHELEYLLRQSDTHTLVMIDSYKDSDYLAIIDELCPELKGHDGNLPLHTARFPFLRHIITIDKPHEGCLYWKDALKLAQYTDQSIVERRAASISKHDVCNMQYTSGTTGFPKGVMLTHYNVVNNGKAIGDCMDLSTADRMMIQVPMFHCFGMVLAMTASVTHGVTMSPIPAFSPSKGLACINSEKITAFHGVPTMFIAMLNHKDFPNTDFSHMRTGIMAGSPCPIAVMQEVIEKMHMDEICITYGQTEASPGCTMSKITDDIQTRVNSVGCALYGVECKIVDPETNQDLPDNTDGEFVARGYNIMKGYYKMPQATAAAIDADGWLHTGDLARRDERGYYRITGRIKDMIIRGGENIYPKEIEDFLYTHPKIRDVQVIGVPDKAYGEEIMACVILNDGESMTEQEVKDYVMTHMAKHKTPRYVSFVNEFPMNAAGKVLKYKMREEAIRQLSLQEAAGVVTA